MRTLLAALIGVLLLPAAISNPERRNYPTVAASTLSLREVRRVAEGAVIDLDVPTGTLVVDRPADAREGARSSVFVLDPDRMELQRVIVEYGRVSASMIEIVGGLSAGHRIVISDMAAWAQYERLRVSVR